ncbi:MAG: putative spermidine/putrescine transport system substrate-binding protein [Paracoccaceae bacterium]|jgi:putative spermidine/putrescine transport system substrate-binding protein
MKLKTIMITVSAVALSASAAVAADLTVTSWGGGYTASQQKAYGEPWEAATGKTIHWESYNGGLGEVKTQVESGNITWDIVDLLADNVRIGCDEGLFEELPDSIFMDAPDGSSMDEDLMVDRPNKCAAPQIWWSYQAFYEADEFSGDQPSTLNDFFDTAKYPGKRGVHTWANAIVEMALVADGVAIADVYDVMSTSEGIDRAFAKLDTIKDDVVFWSSGAKPLELVTSGEVAMSIAYNGRVGGSNLNDGTNFVSIWDGQVLEEEWLGVVKGTPNLEAALDFIRLATSTEAQANQAKWINYGPMRNSALAVVEAGEPWFNTGVNVLEHMPNRAEVVARTIVADPDWWADNGDEVQERYKAWMSQ